MNSGRTGVRGKLPWIILIAVLVVCVVVGGIVHDNYLWQRVPSVEVNGHLVLTGSMRTSAQHDEFMRERDWPHVIEIDPEGDGALYYFGSGHTRDPDDPQISQITQAWNEFGPTVALVESYMGFYIGGVRGGVKMFGEVGAVYALARDAHVPMYSLDPPLEVEARALADRFGERETLMYYMLRAYVAERGERATEDAQNDLAMHLLGKRAEQSGLGDVLKTAADLDSLWASSFAGLPDWRTLDPKEMWPGEIERTVLTSMSNHSNTFRDEHQARVICDLAGRGERVFAICGGSHVVKQEPVLRATLESSTAAPEQEAAAQ